jgi:hypothetical protein
MKTTAAIVTWIPWRNAIVTEERGPDDSNDRCAWNEQRRTIVTTFDTNEQKDSDNCSNQSH